MAYRLGDPEKQTVVLFSTMHGDEPHTRQILRSLKDGPPSRASTSGSCRPTTLTVSPRAPARTRRGVDLNRNFPYSWADLDGSYESGPGPPPNPRPAP